MIIMNDSTYSMQWQFIQPWPILILQRDFSPSFSVQTLPIGMCASHFSVKNRKKPQEKINTLEINMIFDLIKSDRFHLRCQDYGKWKKKKKRNRWKYE